MNHSGIDKLLDLVLRFEYDGYDALIGQLFATEQDACLGELYRIRAQVKLLTIDDSFRDDLLMAEALLPAEAPRVSVYTEMKFSDPNGFILFPAEAGALSRYLAALRASYDLLTSVCGEPGCLLAKQIESVILYYTGDIAGSLKIAERVNRSSFALSINTLLLMSGYVMLRCYLAVGRADDAETIYQQIISWSKDSGEANCAMMYQTIRAWTNLTTGWSGDMPRFHTTPDGVVFPVLEDRAAAIIKGISDLGPTEEPLVRLAKRKTPSVYTMRQLFMDIYHAVVNYNFNTAASVTSFLQAFQITSENQLVMPFAEYGMQIIPLLEHVAHKQPQLDNHFLELLISQANLYEKSLLSFRGE